jgi:hypothetical protein
VWKSIGEYWANIAVSAAISIIIWQAGLWSSGDAKLFIAYAFILPLKYYEIGYFNFFPAIALLINTFFPVLFVLFFYVALKNRPNAHWKAIKTAFHPKLILTIFFFVFGFSWLIGLFLNLIGIKPNLFLIIIILFILLFIVRKYLKINFLLLLAIISLLRLIFGWKDLASASLLVNLLISALLLLFLRFYVLNLAYNIFAYPVYIEQLKESMLPAEDIIKRGGKIEKKRHLQISFIQALLNKVDEKSLLESLPEGLTLEEIEKIQVMHSRGEIKEHTLNVYKTFPFAPFMLLGAIITLLISGNVIQYLVSFL